MNWGNSGKPRPSLRTDRLTDEERRFITSLGTSSARIAKFLGMSSATFAELRNPLGRAKPATLARIRARIAELQNEQENPRP